MMPRLGEAAEPSRFERVQPWWRPIAALHKPDKSDRAGEESGDLKLLEEPID